ncbi:hypothetical protein CIPAW_01G235600 [Carya illinoinensis]|uniref:Uncharacterized protein n=1 Tax=Carya illinoinensis TaxID=32201 RepID=A0A8T1RRI5_CARIL|nr:hypothetical protein CIPAW_01G235600 [Carya illinoinensis]
MRITNHLACWQKIEIFEVHVVDQRCSFEFGRVYFLVSLVLSSRLWMF